MHQLLHLAGRLLPQLERQQVLLRLHHLGDQLELALAAAVIVMLQ